MKNLKTKFAVNILFSIFILANTVSQIKSQNLISGNSDLPQSSAMEMLNPIHLLIAGDYQLNCGIYTSLEWNIYLMHTNTPVPFEYAGGQYFFDFDPSIANGGELSFSIIGSDLPPDLQPTNPQIVGNQLRLNINPFPPPGSGYILSGSTTKIARVRLTTSSTSFSGDAHQIGLQFRTGPSDPSTKIYAYVNNSLSEITSAFSIGVEETHCATHMILQIMPWDCCHAKLLSPALAMEGFYDSSTNQLSRKDTITVELRDAFYPHPVRYTAKCRVDSINLSSFHVFTFDWLPPQVFYVVVKHLNSLETWSKIGIQLSRGGYVNQYNFTDSITRAFGNNLKLKGTKYTIYSGDVNQDKIIDASDLSLIDNDVFNSVTGTYLPTDVNGDNIVDAADLSITDNNTGIMAITPLDVTRSYNSDESYRKIMN